MPEESTTTDLVECIRGSIQAGSDRDIDRALTFYTPDAIWDMSPWGMGTFEGIEAIRGFFEDWLGAYEEYPLEAEEIVDLGNGVAFAVLHQGGRPSGSTGEVQLLRVGDRVGERADDTVHELPRHRRGPRFRRTPRRGPGGMAMSRENMDVVWELEDALNRRDAPGGSRIAGAGFEPASFGL